MQFVEIDEFRKRFDDEFKKAKTRIDQGETHLDNLAEGFAEADQVLRSMPKVDAEIVTRCKDCRYRTQSGVCEHPRHTGVLPTAYPFDFCSYGKGWGD